MDDELTFCAHYPFSPQSKAYVMERKLEFLSSHIDEAERRLVQVISTGKLMKAPDLREAKEKELVLYAICRMILSAAGNRYLINRYAVAEAKRASECLSSDMMQNEEWVDKVAEGLGISFSKESPPASAKSQKYCLPLAKYLEYAPRSTDYKLSNREVFKGKVAVNSHERVRLIEEAVKKKIESELPIREAFPKEIVEAAKRVLAAMPKTDIGVQISGKEGYPPCIRKMLEELEMSINLPHNARVALAIYLIKAGLDDAKIKEAFRKAPDFSERTTSYQIEYLRKKGYSMPSCATMDSYGICVADCRCGNPLNFKASVHGKRLSAGAEGEMAG